MKDERCNRYGYFCIEDIPYYRETFADELELDIGDVIINEDGDVYIQGQLEYNLKGIYEE